MKKGYQKRRNNLMLTLALCVALTLGAFCFAAESEDASNEVVMTAEEAFVAEQMEEVEAEETVEETVEIIETEETVEEVVEETAEIVEEVNDEVNEIEEEVVEEAAEEETVVDVTEEADVEVEDEMVTEIETTENSDEAEEVVVEEETVESTMHGAARAPYFEVNGEAAYCVDPEATHPENGTPYSGKTVTDYSFLNKVFINRELLKGQDDEMLNRATQLAVWQTVNPTGNYAMAAKAFLNERGFEFYKQLLADVETEGWNVDYTLYTTSEVDAAGNAIQRLISAFANKAMILPEFNSAPIVEVPVEEPEAPVEEPEIPVEEPEAPVEEPKEETPEAPVVEEVPEDEIPEIPAEEPKKEVSVKETKVETRKAEPVKEEKVVVTNDGVRMLSTRLPKTGDSSNVYVYIALVGLSLATLIYVSKKNNR